MAFFIDLQARTHENDHTLLIFSYFNLQEIHLWYADPEGRKTLAVLVDKWHLVHRATTGPQKYLHRQTAILKDPLYNTNGTEYDLQKKSLHSKLTVLKACIYRKKEKQTNKQT